MGFWVKKGLRNRSWKSTQMNARSSERHFPLPRIVSRPFAQASAKRTPGVQNLKLRLLGRLSELPSLKRATRILHRILKIACSLKRTVSEQDPDLREFVRSSEQLLA